MSFLEIILTALSLSLDATAVSIAAGALNKISIKQAFKIAAFFGIFQLVMPIIGWEIGSSFKEYILNYSNIIGFIALLALGSKMFYEAIKKTNEEEINNEKHITQNKVLLLLAITTSIDALVVGITFNFLNVNIPLAVITIGIITFFLCLGGVYVGKRGRNIAGNKIEIVGALILIALAFKILLVK